MQTSPSTPSRPGSWAGLLWLSIVAATAGASLWVVARGSGFVANTAVPLALLFGLALLERRLPGDESHRWENDPQLPCDMGHMIAGGWLAELAGSALLVAGVSFLAEAHPVNVWPHAWPIAAQIALLLVLAEGLEYGRHRFLHASESAWVFHRLHHDADRMHVWKGSRIHFGDLLSRFFVVFAPLAMLGVPLELLPTYSLAILCVGPISHSNLSLPLPQWVHRVIVTPDVHRIHHARSKELSGKNLAPVLPVFDILGGTYEAPRPDRRIEFGVEGPAAPTTFLAQLVRPFVEVLPRRTSRRANSGFDAPVGGR